MTPTEVKMTIQPYARPDTGALYYLGWLNDFPTEAIEGESEAWIGEQILLLAARKFLSPIVLINETLIVPLLPGDDDFVGEGFPIMFGPGWDV